MTNKDNYDDLFISTTDTITGIGAPVSSANSEILFKIKKRSIKKNLVIMISNTTQINQFIKPSETLIEYSKKFWPGNTTLIVNDEYSFRMPKNKKLLELIDKLGPIYMTSANMSGEPFLNFEEAKIMFPMIKKHYNFGEGNNVPSSIIRISDGKRIR